MFSHTQFGLSFIMLTFDDKATDYFARQQVLERCTAPTCPPASSRSSAPLSTAIGEIYRYRLKGDGISTRRAAHAAGLGGRAQMRDGARRRRHRQLRRLHQDSTR